MKKSLTVSMGMPRLFLKYRITSVIVDNKKEINFYTDRKTNCNKIKILGRVISVTRWGEEVQGFDKKFAFHFINNDWL